MLYSEIKDDKQHRRKYEWVSQWPIYVFNDKIDFILPPRTYPP